MIPWFRLHEVSRTGKLIEIESRLVVARGWGEGKRGVTADVYGVYFGEGWYIPELDSGDGCTTLWMYEKLLNCKKWKTEESKESCY